MENYTGHINIKRMQLQSVPPPLAFAKRKKTKCERGRMEFRKTAKQVTCHEGSSILFCLLFSH